MGMVRVFQTMAWSRCGDVHLLVHAPGIPLDADWAEFMKDVTTTVMPGIVVAAGSAKLSPKQRSEVQQWFERSGVRGSVVTDSPVARGVVTALSWFKVKLRAFSPRDLDRAFEYAGVEPGERANARAELEQLQRALHDRRRTSAAG
jgi:hypothetical protein